MKNLTGDVFSEEDFDVLDSGGKISCPYKRCDGFVKKIRLNGEAIYTELEYKNLKEYVCSKNKKHYWGSIH